MGKEKVASANIDDDEDEILTCTGMINRASLILLSNCNGSSVNVSDVWPLEGSMWVSVVPSSGEWSWEIRIVMDGHAL